jgi:uncharacterized phiE125 gp8 family phage protein
MARAFSVTTPAGSAIITTAVAKAHLKVDVSDDDTLIDNLINAATQIAEDYTNRYFINTTLKMVGDKWDDITELYKSPVSSVSSIKYYDSDNSQQTLASSVYLVDLVSKPCNISLKVDQSFPDLADRKMAVEVNYVVGEGGAGSDVSDLVKEAVLLMVGHWYQNREAVVIGRIATEIPMAAKMILDQYKIQVC